MASAPKPVIQVQQPLITGPSFKSIDDDVLLRHQVKGATGIE